MSHTEWGVRWWEGDDQHERTVACTNRDEAEQLHAHLVKIATPERRAELPLRKHGAELLVRLIPDWSVRIAALPDKTPRRLRPKIES